MTLVECRTGAEVIQNAKEVRNRMRSLPGVRDTGIDLSRPANGRRGYDPEPAIIKKVLPIIPRSPARGGSLSVAEIQSAVVEFFKPKIPHLTRRDLVSQSRFENVVWPRQVAMYLCRIGTTRTYPSIARLFGGRDHTTVLHAVQKINQLLVDHDERAVSDVAALRVILSI